MLNACIPQPVSQLFTDNIGLFCTREVTGSLLDWGEKQPLQHVPVNPQLLCFFFSLDHSLIQQSIKKLVDVLYSSHYLSQGVSAGTKASATRSFKRYLLLWLHPQLLLGGMCKNTVTLLRHCLTSPLQPRAQLPHWELTEAGAGDPSCSASPTSSQSLSSTQISQETPRNSFLVTTPQHFKPGMLSQVNSPLPIQCCLSAEEHL